MKHDTPPILLYLKNYTNNAADRFFLWKEDVLSEVGAAQILQIKTPIVCHDYWLIAQSIFEATNELPNFVIDIEEFRAGIVGRRVSRNEREKKYVISHMHLSDDEKEIAKKYINMWNRSVDFDIQIYTSMCPLFISYWLSLVTLAKEKDEYDRLMSIEFEVFNTLYRSLVFGIAIDNRRLSEHKKNIDHDYYMALKNFSADYGFSLEVPCEEDVIDYIEKLGYDLSGISLDYILNFFPDLKFSSDLKNLKKLSNSRNVLSLIPNSKERIFPIIDIFGTATSRIYFKDPILQNLAKRYRNIIKADEGDIISYVDYGQYELGIMAALSEDESLLELYSKEDAYTEISNIIFNDVAKRKISKRLFLAFSYGMEMNKLFDAAVNFGADRETVKSFFRSFTKFLKWKETVYSRFISERKIGTSLGNFIVIDAQASLTAKQKRSAISQVVQGTASLIFKKLILEVGKDKNLKIKVPLHDALLINHAADYDPKKICLIFEACMSEHFDGKIKGKASLSDFF